MHDRDLEWSVLFPINVTQDEAKPAAVVIVIHPFVDGGMLRVGGRIVKAKINYDARHPLCYNIRCTQQAGTTKELTNLVTVSPLPLRFDWRNASLTARNMKTHFEHI